MNYPQISGYIYPPTVLPLLGRLARYDYDWARTAWLALDVAVFSLMVLVAVVVSRGRRLEVLTAAVPLTMVSFAFFYHVHEGHIDMIVAGLSISAFLLYPRWGGWPSAALLSMRMWPYRMLDMTNIIGGAIAALWLMRYYLPLEIPRELADRLEQLLADETLRTHPVVGQVLEGGARRLYVRLRVTDLRVVDVRPR
jgi:hypothetical protein